MLKIFVSSTSRDLAEFRDRLLKELDQSFKGIGMEDFIPDGATSQIISVKELRESNIIIFFISPNYGSLIQKCEIANCEALECPMRHGKDKISFTHCEYKTALAKNKLHMTYLIDIGWDSNVNKRAWEFREEISKENFGKITDLDNINVIQKIKEHLAENIVKWHSEGLIKFDDFCDRKIELKELYENTDRRVEIYGVGGVGKTTLIQVALLIQKLKGKTIITVGLRHAYSTGSGYETFREKCKEAQYSKIIGNIITLDDIINALTGGLNRFDFPEIDDLHGKSKEEKTILISDTIEKKEIILFIDDFHQASKDVIELVKVMKCVIFSSRKDSNISAKKICLMGISEEDRDEFINLISGPRYYNILIPTKIREKIKQLTEGHPVSMELLVKNFEKINFDELNNFRKSLDFTNPDQVEEFLKRIVKGIISKEALNLLKHLAVLNSDLERNLDKSIVEKVYETTNFTEVFNELIDTRLLKKKEGLEGNYQFSFLHIQEALKSETNKQEHEKAIKYYLYKKERHGENINDAVECFYHEVKLNPSKNLIKEFLKLKTKIHPIHFNFNRLIESGEIFKSFLQEESKAPILLTLGNLYSDLKRFDAAENSYLEALKIYKRLAEKRPDAYLPDIAMTQNNLGNLFWNLKRFDAAENSYLEALKIRRELAEKRPDAYLPVLASTQNNLGVLYSDLKRFDAAENSYLKALKIYKRLAEKRPDAYLPVLASTQNNLGNLYSDLKRFDAAENSYLEALKIRRELAEKRPDAYLPVLASTQNNLGNLYSDLKRFDAAENSYLEALKLCKRLAEKRPDAYLPVLALTQNNLGVLYRNLRRFDAAENSYLEALKIRRELAEKRPDAYLPVLASTQNNLGVLYRNLRRFDAAENSYLEALKIYKRLAEKRPDAYLPVLASTQNNLGVLFWNLKRFDAAEKSYLEALKIYKKLAEKRPDAYLPVLAKTQNNLGVLYSDLKRFDAAENAYLEALKIYKRLAEKRPDAYLPDVAMTQNNLGILYRNLRRFDAAEKSYLEALKIRRELAEKRPDVYLSVLAKTQNNLKNLYSLLKKNN